METLQEIGKERTYKTSIKVAPPGKEDYASAWQRNNLIPDTLWVCKYNSAWVPCAGLITFSLSRALEIWTHKLRRFHTLHYPIRQLSLKATHHIYIHKIERKWDARGIESDNPGLDCWGVIGNRCSELIMRWVTEASRCSERLRTERTRQSDRW